MQLLHDATPAAAASAVAAAPEAHTYRWRVAPGTVPLEWAREEAARALHALACGCPSNQSAIAEAGGIAPLVRLLSSGTESAQILSAKALASLAVEHEANEETICAQMVQLLGLSDKQAAARAAQAIARLAHKGLPANQAAFARAGAISLLVTLLKSAGHSLGASKESAASSAYLQRESAAALGALSEGHPANQAAVAAEGGIVPLVAILKEYHQPEVYGEVARALWRVGGHPPNQLAIAHAGGITPLVHLLAQSVSVEAKREAAGALGVLAQQPENRTAIARANGVSALVALFELDSISAAEQAASALTALATDDVANQRAIATELVATLNGSPSVAAQEQVTKLIEDSLIPSACKCSPRRPLPSPQVTKLLEAGHDPTIAHIKHGFKVPWGVSPGSERADCVGWHSMASDGTRLRRMALDCVGWPPSASKCV